MTSLSSLADSLAHTLIAVTQQVTVLAALLWLVALLARKAPPTLRYGLWCVVLVRLCVPVSLSVPFGLTPTLGESGRRAAAFRLNDTATGSSGPAAPAPAPGADQTADEPGASISQAGVAAPPPFA